MKGDFSRRTFDKEKHYSSVLMQQGRVQVDSDWNEQQAIHQYRHETQTGDAIGRCGAPKNEHDGGFEIEATLDGSDLRISEGRIYVDGILCENDRDNATLSKQDDLPMKEEDLAGLALPLAAGRYLVYLGVWQRHITAIDDPDIREKALGGPDTATRVKTVWQVKLHPVESDAECSTLGSWKPDATGSGKLSVQTVSTGTDIGHCVLPPTAGFSRLENQLYRVEIHRGTDPNDPTVKPTFKWSRDNGSVVTSIIPVNGQAIDGQTIRVHDMGRDEVIGFAHDQWVEILDDRMELADQRGHLVQIDTVNPATREITIKTATPLPVIDETRHPKLRRWDQSGATATADGVEITTDEMPLEGGIEVQFSGGTYRSGDYWLIPARAAISTETGSIEWEGLQSPHGIHHHYCPLALVDFDGSKFSLNSDCRHLFPPLTDITAGDVRFDNNICQLPNAETVQDALNGLCQQRGGGCTLVVTPGSGWEAIFDRIADEQDARVCFHVGEYLLDEPITLANKGHLTICGCGAGTRIIASKAETVFEFEGCKSVVVRDLYAKSGVTGSGKGGQLKHLNGTLTFSACPKVTVENVELKCGAGAERAASCISVRDSAEYARGTEGRLIYADGRPVYFEESPIYVDRRRFVAEPRTGIAERVTTRPSVRNATEYMAEARDVAELDRIADERPIYVARRSFSVKPVASVRIRNCDLHIGHQQVGVLLVNVLRAYVEDNVLQVSKKPGSLSMSVLLQNTKYRSAVRSLMIREAELGRPDDDDDVILAHDVVGISAGEDSVWFKTDPSLVAVWENWIKRNPPKGVQNDRDLLRHIKNVADQVLLNRGVPGTGNQRVVGFEDWYNKLNSQNPAVGSQGIVVGGSIAKDIHILHNSIRGVLQGVHIGVSHHVVNATTPELYAVAGTDHLVDRGIGVIRHAVPYTTSITRDMAEAVPIASSGIRANRRVVTGSYDMAGTVQIVGNNILVPLSPAARERHGIFVGNCDSLIIQDNYASVQRFPVTSMAAIDGIRIYGHLGRMMVVRQNHLVGTTVGIRVVPLIVAGTGHGRPQWVVTDNIAPNARNAVIAPSSVRGRSDNYA